MGDMETEVCPGAGHEGHRVNTPGRNRGRTGRPGRKAGELAKEHPDQVKQGVEKAGDVADEKTGGQHSDQIDKAEQAAEERLTGGSDEDGPGQQ